MDALDALVRTVAGEAGKDPREQAAVAAAIINRARVQGKPIADIISAPGQFESWSNPKARARMQALDANSPQYQAILKAVEPIYSGTAADPTNGATHFYAPKAQASLGRNPPKWDDGKGSDIGQSRFFNKGAPTATDTFDNLASMGPDTPAPAQGGKSFDFEDVADMKPQAAAPTKATERGDLTAGIQPFIAARDKAGALKFMADNGQTVTDPTQIDRAIASRSAAVVNMTPLPAVSDSAMTNAGIGFKQGTSDVIDGTFGKLGNYIDSKVPILNQLDQAVAPYNQAVNSLITGGRNYDQNRAVYDATVGKTTAGEIGRIGGQVVASAPFMAAGGSLLGAGGRLAVAASPEMAAPVSFLAGNAGKAVAADAVTGAPAVAGNALVRGGSLAAKGSQLMMGGTALTSGASDQPFGDQMKNAAELGAVLGPAGGIVSGVAGKIKDAVAPTMSSGMAKLADLAINKYGIDLRGSQISPNMLLKRWDAQHANSLLGDFGEQNASQKGQFTRAVGQTFGADGEQLTPEVMTAAKNRIGKVYDTVGTRTTLDLSPETGSTFLDDITNAHSAANLGPANAGRAQKLLDEVLAKVGPDGTMSGTEFKKLTSRGSMLDNATSSADGEYRDFAKTVRAGLNQELERAASPEDVAALQKANWQWKNMRTVEKAIGPDGQISPALLQSKVNTSFKDNKYSGAGDLGELGQIGQLILKPPSSSGTVENAKAAGLFSNMNLVTGAGLGVGSHFLGVTPGVDLALAALPVARSAASAGGNALAAKLYGNSKYANKLIGAALNNNVGASGLPLASNLLPPAIVAGNRIVNGSRPAN